jgi:spore coat polysaccharide biosynthesis protein SpsF
MEDLLLKRAEEKDVDLLFNWRNDFTVREQSLSSEKIAYEDHVRWFSKKMNDSNCYLYIAYLNNIPVGMIRFDVDRNMSVINYLVDKTQRGKGIGTAMVTNGLKTFLNDSSVEGMITATVKILNPASIKIFETLKFEKESTPGNEIRFKKLFN